MNKLANRIATVSLCTLLISGVQSPIYAAQDTPAPEKEETVYVMAEADGSVSKVIVSDWLKNTTGADKIDDMSTLEDIENVKGDEDFTRSGDSIVWNAGGSDIYYQGTADKELPIGLKVTYTIDGKTVSANEIAGKSGHVVIRFEYENRQFEKVEIDGSEEKIYVPYIAITGAILNNDVFRNIEVSSGKIVNDGDKTTVIGYALPGLQESLKVSEDKVKLPGYFEITADVQNFGFGSTYTVVTNDLFNSINFDKAGSLEDVDQLDDGMAQLLDGSAQLSDGLSELLEKSGELVEGIDALVHGSAALKSGTGALDEGAKELSSGVEELNAGLEALVSNNDALNAGAKQVFETLLATANMQLKSAGLDVPEMTVENYSEVLEGVLASLDESAFYKKVQDAVTEEVKKTVSEKVVETVKAEVEEQVTSAVRTNVAEQVIKASLNMDTDSYNAAVEAGKVDTSSQAKIEAAIDQQMQTNEVKSVIKEKVTEQMASEDIKNLVKGKIAEQMESEEIKKTVAAETEKAVAEQLQSEEVKSQLEAAKKGSESVKALKESLDSYNTFYTGILRYTAGVSQAADGAGELASGAKALEDGAGELYAGSAELSDGIAALKAASSALIEGITQLSDGSQHLYDGLIELDEKGIKKLTGAAEGGIGGLIERLRAAQEVSRKYVSFSGIDGKMSGKVKFVFRTESIG